MRALGTRGLGAARLIALAEGDPAMHVRIAAVEALGLSCPDESAEALLTYAAGAETDLAAAAIRSLGRCTDVRVAAALRSALRSPAPALRHAALTALGARPTEDGIAALQWTAAADPDDAVALAAVDTLAAIGGRADDQATAAVTALLMSTAEPRTKDAAISALSQLPESRLAALAGGLSHAQAPVRIATIAALCRMQRPEASAAIRTALDDADASVREAAVVALERLGVRGVGRRLALMMREDPSRAVRRAAAAAVHADEGIR